MKDKELLPCPYCKQTGVETVYNHETDENENIECTGCWGDMKVTKGTYDNYFIETGKENPRTKENES